MEGQGERKGGKGQKGREKTIYVHLYAHVGQKRRKGGGTHMELEPKYTTVEQCRHSHHSSMIQLWHACKSLVAPPRNIRLAFL